MDQLKELPIPLLLWYRENARVLPWRSHPTPYRVWVSEIMLQQTRVAAVLDYYRRFLEALPTVADLAAVPEDALMKLWQGLGYYSRARNLQRAARQIMEEHGGIFPSTYEEIRALSGVGDYTAGAISSIAFGLPVPAVDGNVLRVAARVTGDEGDIAAPATKKAGDRRPGRDHPPGRPRRLQSGHDGAGGHRLPAQRGAPVRPLPSPGVLHCPPHRPDRPAAGEGGQEGPEGGGAHRLSHLPRKPGGPAAQAGTGASGRAVGVPQRALSRRGRPGPLGHCSCLPPERRDGEAYLHPHRVAHVRPGGGGELPRAAGGVGLGGPGCPGPGIRRPQRLPALSRGGGGEAGTFLTGGGNAMICDLCPRRCGALRTEERGLGRCRMPELPVLARAALHRWEEPPISGTRGSGTIFFLGLLPGLCVLPKRGDQPPGLRESSHP